MKTNYQLEMERVLARIKASGARPRLLLHSCCAPCSSAVLERLTHFFDGWRSYGAHTIPRPSMQLVADMRTTRRAASAAPAASGCGWGRRPA